MERISCKDSQKAGAVPAKRSKRGALRTGGTADKVSAVKHLPRRRLPPDARREQILTEAISFFAEQGIAGTTRELSERLQVTQPLLYNYFPSKQDLLDAVYERIYLGRLKPHWGRLIVDEAIPLRERMTTFYVEYANAILTREWVRLFVFAGLQGDDLNRRYIGQLSRTVIAPLHAEVSRQIRSTQGAKAKQPTMDDMWVHHGGVFYLGIREHIYGLGAAADRDQAITDAVARFLDAYGLWRATACPSKPVGHRRPRRASV